MKFSQKGNSIFFILCLLLPCTAYTQLQKIYYNPKAPGNAKQSEFVDSIRFIPLELRDDIKVAGQSNITVTDNYFLLTDYEGRFLVVYTKDGRFVKKISYKKLGEGFYPGYYSFTNELIFFGRNRKYALTPKDQIKIRLDWNNPRNQKYFKKYRVDLNDTSFALEKVIPNENDLVQSYPFYKGYYSQVKINTSPLYKDGEDYELKIYKNKKLEKKYFPYNRINEPRFLFTEGSVALIDTDDPANYIVTRPYCDTIYKMNLDSLVPAYQLVMPMENSLPPSFFTTSFKNKTERENFQRNNGWKFVQVVNFYETPRLYYFTVSYQSNYEAYIYQKQGNATYKVRSIKSDSSQYNLKLLADLNLRRKGDQFFKMETAGELQAFFEKNKNTPVPKDLEAFLNSKPPATASVIVEFKLKSAP